MAVAHSQNSRGECHDLVKHLTDVAELASQFADKFGASSLSYWLGLWHDIGKFYPTFQAYLKNPASARGPDHKGAGAILALKYVEPLSFLVAGHHHRNPIPRQINSERRPGWRNVGRQSNHNDATGGACKSKPLFLTSCNPELTQHSSGSLWAIPDTEYM